MTGCVLQPLGQLSVMLCTAGICCWLAWQPQTLPNASQHACFQHVESSESRQIKAASTIIWKGLRTSKAHTTILRSASCCNRRCRCSVVVTWNIYGCFDGFRVGLGRFRLQWWVGLGCELLAVYQGWGLSALKPKTTLRVAR